MNQADDAGDAPAGPPCHALFGHTKQDLRSSLKQFEEPDSKISQASFISENMTTMTLKFDTPEVKCYFYMTLKLP